MMQRGVIIGLLMAFASSCAAAVGPTQSSLPATQCDPISPAAHRLHDPGAAGADREKMAAAVQYAAQQLATSVRVYRHGCLIGVSAFDAATQSKPTMLWSETKGVVSLITGRAITLGLMSLDDSIANYLPGVDAAHARITIRHLLTQTSGLRFAWANDVVAGVGDSVAHTLSLPFDHEPGTYYEYAQTTVTVLAAVIQAAANQDVQDFAREQLFEPLGISRDEWLWDRDGAGNTFGFAFLQMSPIAMAKFGHLMLNRGHFGERQLIDEGYVDAMHTPGPANASYGFLAWNNSGTWGWTGSILKRRYVDHRSQLSLPPDAFGLSGLLDQYLVVIPSWDMVIVRHGLFGPSNWRYEFFKAIGQSLTDVDYPNPPPYVYEPEVDIDLPSLWKALDPFTWPT